jgi:hypothetical protein
LKPSEQYRRDAEALRDFREAYVELVNASAPHQPRFLTELGPGVSHDRWSRLRSEVSTVSGAAIPAYGRHGAVFSLRNAAYMMTNVNPVANWEMSFRDPEQLPPETVVSVVESAIGLADKRADEAAHREHGLVGLVASFLRWPSELREAVGPGHAAQRRAAGVLGIAAQVVVGVITALSVTVIAAGGVALWHVFF